MKMISKSEREEILARYPDAWIVSAKHHSYLMGHDDSAWGIFLRRLRGENVHRHRAGKNQR